ncbi:MAG: PocR ligand-binding domain-containing protein [Calditrichota bacterium]
MIGTLSHNLDFVFFCYGLSYLLVAAVTSPLQRKRTHGLPWWLLGSFAILLGIVAWSNTLALAFGDSVHFAHFRLLLMILSYAFLTEFGRRTLAILGVVKLPWWTTAGLLLVAIGSFFGSNEVSKVIPRYVLALPGGLLTAWGFWKLSQRVEYGKPAMRMCAIAMVFLAISAGLITSEASFFPANVLNQSRLLESIGLSAAFVRGIIALFLAFALSKFVSQLPTKGTFFGEQIFIPYGHTRIMLVLIPILVVGWVGVSVRGTYKENSIRQSFREKAEYLAAIVHFNLDKLLSNDGRDSLAIDQDLHNILKQWNVDLPSGHALFVFRKIGSQYENILTSDQMHLTRSMQHLPLLFQDDIEKHNWFTKKNAVITFGDQQYLITTVPLTAGHADPQSSFHLILVSEIREMQAAIYRRRLLILAIIFVLSISVIGQGVLSHRLRQSMAETALIANRYRFLFDHSLAGNYVSTPDGRILLCNESFRRILGLHTGEENAVQVQSFYVHQVRREKFIEQLTTDRALNLVTEELRRTDGRIIYVSENATGTFDEDGRLVQIQGSIIDLTDRRLAEQALQQREQQLQSLFANMLEGVALHELIFDDNFVPINYRILEINKRYEEIINVRRDDVVNKLATEVYGTPDPPYLRQFSQVWLSGKPSHIETFFPPLGKHFDISIAPWGELGFATIFTDITARKQAEQQIQALNASLESRIIALTQPLDDTSTLRLEDIFDLTEIQKIQDAFAKATGVASIITDTNGNPITRPSNFCHLCEQIIRKTDRGLENCYHSDAIIGRKHPDGPIVQPCLSGGLWDGGTSICVGDHHIANWLIGQVLEEPVNDEVMIKYAHEIGADEAEFRKALKDVTRMSREQFAKVCDALYIIANQLSNLAVQNVQQARFITERKKAEEERNRLEEQLRQALKLESIGHLAGGIAHDFNNMLTPIAGYAELLQYQLSKDHPYQEILEQIMRAAMRARDLTRQLLAFARKQTLAMKPLNLNDVISNFERMLRRTLRENVTFEINLAPALGSFMGDEGQIEQIILNLSLNAQDAMPEGGQLKIETGEVELDGSSGDGVEEVVPGPYIRLMISDTGIGMDKDVLSRIFDPFFTTKGLGRGTGLGLSTVHGIVGQHGGHIWVTSEPGQGTTFQICFPRSAEQIETFKPIESKAEPRRGKETILLVEDEEQVRAVAFEILREYGYEVLPAADGDAALKIAEGYQKPIDLLVTDIIMPTMNGRQLFETLVQTRPDLKVLYMSGYSDDVIANHGVLDEGVDFIQKPFSLHALASKVRLVIDDQNRKVRS